MSELLLGFGAGMGTILFILLFISWMDVAIFKKPFVDMMDKKPWKAYFLICAWEMSFAFIGCILGILIGLYVL